MNTTEHLLAIAAEECAEIALEASSLAQRLTKALRFGLNETQPGQERSNLRRIVDGYETLLQEGNDLHAVLGMLQLVPSFDDCVRIEVDNEAVLAKQEKIRRFLAYSRECGTLCDDVVAEMRTMAMVAGHAGVEGPADSRAAADLTFAEHCTRWADRLEGKQP